MEIHGEGLADEDGEGLTEGRKMYVIHPNCDVDEMLGRGTGVSLD